MASDLLEGGTSRRQLSRAALVERLQGVKLLSLDVDGVLTDGGLYYTDDGQQLRKFNVKDGMGIQRVRAAGAEVAVISAAQAPAILRRGESLGLDHVHVGCEDKLAALEKICQESGFDLSDVAHMGDDLNDVPVLEAVGLPLSVADAVAEARAAAAYVTSRRGGDGAVREICDLMVSARGDGV
ncbi:MAG: HAD hydrolase family protein [Rhodospirillales bacterium]|jgi:3-deoxy-D-manno-octulosonate 8-phosphate phosphatase (KDO 8-P phosphatase)|nr:HAD hydrolase family protein [Rhodospirillales bacterium]MDP6883475.1 HAD hydrolase family protein [Rhodospirillales bacterium]